MSCDDCTRAYAGIWGGYSARCPGCSARAIARSLAAFHAWDAMGDGDVQPLRELVERLLPTLSREEAKQAIRRWWDHDRAAIAKSRPRSAWMDEA